MTLKKAGFTLLLVALLTTFGFLVSQRIRLVHLQTELQQLLVDFPLLSVIDTEQIQVIQISEFGRGQWNWRIWVPEKLPLYLSARVGETAESTQQMRLDYDDLSPGSQFLISVGIDQQQFLMLHVQEMQESKLSFSSTQSMSRGSSFESLNLFDFDWSDEYLGQELLELAGYRQTTLHPTSESITLLKLRRKSRSDSATDGLPFIEISISTLKPQEDHDQDDDG